VASWEEQLSGWLNPNGARVQECREGQRNCFYTKKESVKVKTESEEGQPITT